MAHPRRSLEPRETVGLSRRRRRTGRNRSLQPRRLEWHRPDERVRAGHYPGPRHVHLAHHIAIRSNIRHHAAAIAHRICHAPTVIEGESGLVAVRGSFCRSVRAPNHERRNADRCNCKQSCQTSFHIVSCIWFFPKLKPLCFRINGL